MERVVFAEIEIAEIGTVALELSWHRCNASAITDANTAEAKALNLACNEVLKWGSTRMESILETLTQQLQKRYGDCFKAVYVFGSYAQPDAGLELPNDLNVALVLSDFDDPHVERFTRITSDLFPKGHMLVSITPIREDDFACGEETLIHLISPEAIHVA